MTFSPKNEAAFCKIFPVDMFLQIGKQRKVLQRQLEAITVSFQQKSFCLLKDLPIQSKYFKEKALCKKKESMDSSRFGFVLFTILE